MNAVPPTVHLNPAGYVIHHFGGVRRLAAALRVDPSLPSNWQRRRDKRGNAGLIPQAHHKRILELAAERGLPIEERHLVHGGKIVPVPEPEQAAG